jgi:hypothetical protein
VILDKKGSNFGDDNIFQEQTRLIAKIRYFHFGYRVFGTGNTFGSLL